MSDQDDRISITVRAVSEPRKKPRIRIKQQKTRFICRQCTTKSVYYLPYCLCCGGKLDEFPRRASYLQIDEVPRRMRDPLFNLLSVLAPETATRSLKKTLKREEIIVACDLMMRENIVLSALIGAIGITPRLIEGDAPAEPERLLLPPGEFVYPDRLSSPLMTRIREVSARSGDKVRMQFGPFLHFALLLLDKLATSRAIREIYIDDNLAQLAGLLRDSVAHAASLFSGGSKLEKLGDTGVAAHLAPHRDSDGPIVIKRRDLRPTQAGHYGTELAVFVQELHAMADLCENVYSRLTMRVAGQDGGPFPELLNVPTHSKTYGVLHRLYAEFEILDNTLKDVMELTE